MGDAMIKFALTIVFLLSFSGLALAGVREERLSNGLRVILKRVEGLPIVSVWSWVHAGSANECPGITGVAHWCEHMNFKGTEKYSRDAMKNLIEREGGLWNGYTWLDQTAYYETLPSTALDLALDIESQRLCSSLFLPAEVASERSVIISELQMGENDPENLLDIDVNATAFKAHPYRWPTIGWQSDVEAMTHDDLYGFYKRFYAPKNATLVIVGDIDEDKALASVKKKFGGIPPGEQAGRLHTVEPEQTGEKRIVVMKEGPTPYVEIAYHTPTIDKADFFSLLALNAVLGGAESINLPNVQWRGNASKSSRLYRGLVEKKMAAKAGSLFLPTKYPGLFSIYATAAEGTKLEDLERETLAVVRGIQEEGIGKGEFDKVLSQMRARYVYDGEGVTAQAHILGFFDTLGNFKFGDEFLSKLAGVKKEDVVAVARKYLTGENRTVGWYVPGKGRRPEDSGGPGAGDGGARSLAAAEKAAKARSVPSGPSGRGEESLDSAPAKKPGPVVKLNAVQRKFPNGLTLIMRENHASPSIAVRIDVNAGSMFDPAGKPGCANFAVRMLERGSEEMGAHLIAEKLDSSGTELEVACSRDRAALSARLLKENLPQVLAILAGIVRRPSFPEEEVENLRGQIVTGLEEDAHDTRKVAEDRAYDMVYPKGHPYRHKVEGDIASIKSIRREDLAAFHEKFYRPRVTAVVVAGDFKASEAEGLVKKYFGDWPAGRESAGPEVPAPPLPDKTVRKDVALPDKTQEDIAVAFRGVARDNPDYYALQVMNNILGRFGMGGRLGRTIREEKGMAYYVYSAFVAYRYVGPFMVRAGVNPRNVGPAVEEIHAALMRMIKNGVTEKELRDSKACLVNGVPRQLELNGSVAAALADINFYGLGLDYFERYSGLIERVGAEDVKRVAREYLHPDKASVVLAGPVK